jgi:hypothetical protein
MNRRSIVVIVVAIAAAAILWFGGQALWNALVALHHPRG